MLGWNENGQLPDCPFLLRPANAGTTADKSERFAVGRLPSAESFWPLAILLARFAAGNLGYQSPSRETEGPFTFAFSPLTFHRSRNSS